MINPLRKFQTPVERIGIVLLLLFISSFFWMSPDGFYGDMACWRGWAQEIGEDGLGTIYRHADVNYHPGFLYVLRFYSYLFYGQYENHHYIYVLKCMIFLFDVSTVYLVSRLLNKFGKQPYLALVLLINPGFWYNTICWGQIDTIQTFFCFSSLLLIINNRPVAGAAIFTLALLIKLQAVVIAPLLLLLLIPVYYKQPKILVQSLVAEIVIVLLIISPFLAAGEIQNLWRVITGAVGNYPYISLHACNMWHLIFPNKDLMWVPDNSLVLGITLRNIGFILYILFLFISLYPMHRFLQRERKNENKFILNSDFATVLFLSAGLICLDFFFFNTEMHERYIHPAILFFGLSALLSRKYIPFIIISLAYFLNMEMLLHQLEFPDFVYNFPGLFNSFTIAILYLITLICGHIQIYKKSYF